MRNIVLLIFTFTISINIYAQFNNSFYSIEIDAATIEYEPDCLPPWQFANSLDGIFVDNDSTFAIYLEPEQCENIDGLSTNFDGFELPLISSNLPNYSGKFLGFHAKPTSPSFGHHKVRTEIAITNHTNYSPIEIGDSIFYTFDIYIDPDSEPTKSTGNHYTILSQLWQISPCNSHSPPFSIGLKSGSIPDNNIQTLVFVTRDSLSDNNQGNQIYEYEINEAQWYKFTIYLKPHHQQDQAVVKIWENTNSAFSCASIPLFEWTGEMGYILECNNFEGDGEMDLRFGIYKSSRQERRTKVFFDNIILSSDCRYILPVELVQFVVNADNCKNHLNWTTLSEKDNAYFFIEHSLDGENFKIIDSIEGHGNSSDTHHYYYNHINPSINGANYYRLKQVNFDGTYDLSNIIHNQIYCHDQKISLYPNPLKDKGTFTFPNGLAADAEAEIFIWNSIGQLISVQPFPAKESYFEFELNTSEYPSGLYFVKIKQNDFYHFNSKFMKY